MRIEAEHLTHIYSEGLPFETAALQDISFRAESGEFVALIGHTGSGKSTLIQHLAGLLKPTSGRVLADGREICEKSREALALRRRIGIVFQYPEYQLFEETVLADVCFGPKNLGCPEEECLARANKALQTVGIDPEKKGGVSPFALSGGEKRRVAIAGVLAMEPEVLILDEPTAGLDPAGHDEILEMIDRVRRDRSLTIFLVSHNMDDVVRLADHVLVMENGRLVLEGSPRHVFAQGDKLASIGLALPAAARFLGLLRSKGFALPDNALTPEEAAEAILKEFR